METTITFSPSEQESLRRLGVAAIILFGSRARQLAREASDYDIGILREPGVRDDKELYEGIYDVVAGTIEGLVDIDIVFLDRAPLELQMHTARFGEPLFEARRGVFAAFKETVIILYADFMPYRRMFQEQALRRIPYYSSQND